MPNDTQSIVYLVLACVFLLLSGLCLFYFIYCWRHPTDFNTANQKSWFPKWLYKNRLTFSLILSIVAVLCTVVFFLGAFGIAVNIPGPDS